MKRVRILISGRVQGVFYRVSAREKAIALELSGWVRNLENGMVMVEAQGQPEKVEELIHWCRKGPEQAEVTEIESSFIPIRDENRFRILR